MKQLVLTQVTISSNRFGVYSQRQHGFPRDGSAFLKDECLESAKSRVYDAFMARLWRVYCVQNRRCLLWTQIQTRKQTRSGVLFHFALVRSVLRVTLDLPQITSASLYQNVNTKYLQFPVCNHFDFVDVNRATYSRDSTVNITRKLFK